MLAPLRMDCQAPSASAHLVPAGETLVSTEACFNRYRFERSYNIGGVSLRLQSASARDVDGGAELKQFASEKTDGEIEVEIRWVDEIPPTVAQTDFDSGATWRLSRLGHELVFEFTSPVIGAQPYKQLRVNRSFSRAELILSRNALQGHKDFSVIEYPVSELLVTNYLAHRGHGVELHGCGLIDAKTGGHLFLGHSGAGKSTTARLWQQLRGPEILSDDRIILRLHDEELWMYGSPWHGEAAFASPTRAKLERIHILQHGAENRFSPFSRPRAIAEVFARSFPPFHSAVGLERTVEFLKRTLETLPCYAFEFLPDHTSVDAVLAFRDLAFRDLTFHESRIS